MNYISIKLYKITCRFCVCEEEINFAFHSPKISQDVYAYVIYSERKRSVREGLPSLYNKALHTQAKPFVIMEPRIPSVFHSSLLTASQVLLASSHPVLPCSLGVSEQSDLAGSVCEYRKCHNLLFRSPRESLRLLSLQCPASRSVCYQGSGYTTLRVLQWYHASCF